MFAEGNFFIFTRTGNHTLEDVHDAIIHNIVDLLQSNYTFSVLQFHVFRTRKLEV
jgi:hypothetical protein